LPSETNQPSSTILVVEDEGEVCSVVKQTLDTYGYQVVCAENDAQAYDLLKSDWRSVAALIADVNLGAGTTGFDVARFARRLKPDLPVIYMTGASEESIAAFGVEGGVLLAKPFGADELLAAVGKATSRGG
jgi:DNA-binding response OmpR family regulator